MSCCSCGKKRHQKYDIEPEPSLLEGQTQQLNGHPTGNETGDLSDTCQSSKKSKKSKIEKNKKKGKMTKTSPETETLIIGGGGSSGDGSGRNAAELKSLNVIRGSAIEVNQMRQSNHKSAPAAPHHHHQYTTLDREDGLVPVDGNYAGHSRLVAPQARLRNEVDINLYSTKKNIALGMLDIALLTANAAQLKHVLKDGLKAPNDPGYIFHMVNLGSVAVSIALQILIGILLILNSRYNINSAVERRSAECNNNLIIIGVFLITVINVFISVFVSTDQITIH